MTTEQKYEACRDVLGKLADAVGEMPLGRCSRRLIAAYEKATGVIDGLNFVEKLPAKEAPP